MNTTSEFKIRLLEHHNMSYAKLEYSAFEGGYFDADRGTMYYVTDWQLYKQNSTLDKAIDTILNQWFPIDSLEG